MGVSAGASPRDSQLRIPAGVLLGTWVVVSYKFRFVVLMAQVWGLIPTAQRVRCYLHCCDLETLFPCLRFVRMSTPGSASCTSAESISIANCEQGAQLAICGVHLLVRELGTRRPVQRQAIWETPICLENLPLETGRFCCCSCPS